MRAECQAGRVIALAVFPPIQAFLPQNPSAFCSTGIRRGSTTTSRSGLPLVGRGQS